MSQSNENRDNNSNQNINSNNCNLINILREVEQGAAAIAGLFLHAATGRTIGGVINYEPESNAFETIVLSAAAGTVSMVAGTARHYLELNRDSVSSFRGNNNEHSEDKTNNQTRR